MTLTRNDELLRRLRAEEHRVHSMRRTLQSGAPGAIDPETLRASLLEEMENLTAAYDALVRVVAQHRTCDGGSSCFVAGPQDLGPFARALLSDDGTCMTIGEITSAVARRPALAVATPAAL